MKCWFCRDFYNLYLDFVPPFLLDVLSVRRERLLRDLTIFRETQCLKKKTSEILRLGYVFETSLSFHHLSCYDWKNIKRDWERIVSTFLTLTFSFSFPFCNSLLSFKPFSKKKKKQFTFFYQLTFWKEKFIIKKLKANWHFKFCYGFIAIY